LNIATEELVEEGDWAPARRIMGPKGQEGSGILEKLRNEEFHNLYPPPNIIKVIN
jgi:hypothetical protein